MPSVLRVCTLNFYRVINENKDEQASSAVDRRVARGVASFFGAQRLVIIMVKQNSNYKLWKVTSVK